MKKVITGAFLFFMTVTIAQPTGAPQPVEEQYHINYWWWILGVLVAIGVGILIYFLIKKDPKRDAV